MGSKDECGVTDRLYHEDKLKLKALKRAEAQILMFDVATGTWWAQPSSVLP